MAAYVGLVIAAGVSALASHARHAADGIKGRSWAERQSAVRHVRQPERRRPSGRRQHLEQHDKSTHPSSHPAGHAASMLPKSACPGRSPCTQSPRRAGLPPLCCMAHSGHGSCPPRACREAGRRRAPPVRARSGAEPAGSGPERAPWRAAMARKAGPGTAGAGGAGTLPSTMTCAPARGKRNPDAPGMPPKAPGGT